MAVATQKKLYKIYDLEPETDDLSDIFASEYFFVSEAEDEDEEKLYREELLETKRIRRLTRRRFFEAFVSVGLILLVGLFIYLLIAPQMILSELSRDNSDLKDEISALKKVVMDSEEDANGITDMDSIRANALALGMQDPNANQVVSLPLPNDDKLVTVVSYDEMYGVNDEAYNQAVGNLQNYYLENAGD